jgi:hypothetical protein
VGGLALVPVATITLPGVFDRYSVDGATFRAQEMSVSRVTRVHVFDASTRTETSSRAVDLATVTFDFDAATQIVSTPSGYERLEVDGGTRTPVACKRSITDEGSFDSISDDGRTFLCASSAEVIDLVAGTTSSRLETWGLFAGGSNPGASLDPTGLFVEVGNSRSTTIGAPSAYDGSFAAVHWIGNRHEVSGDGRTMLSEPYMPFAVEWQPEFTVLDAKSGSARRTLSITIGCDASGYGDDFSASLSYDGSRVVVRYEGWVRIFSSVSGKELARARTSALGWTSSAPNVFFASARGDAVALAAGRKMSIVEVR